MSSDLPWFTGQDFLEYDIAIKGKNHDNTQRILPMQKDNLRDSG